MQHFGYPMRLSAFILVLRLALHVFLLGEHPRIGALDVCPFIPVKNVTMQDCVECAREFGERLASELGVPGKCFGARLD